MRKLRSANVSLVCRHASSAATIWREAFSCIATNGLSAATGLRFSRTCSAMAATGAIMGFALEKSIVLQTQRVQLMHPLRQLGVHQRPDHRLGERAVKGKISLRYASGG